MTKKRGETIKAKGRAVVHIHRTCNWLAIACMALFHPGTQLGNLQSLGHQPINETISLTPPTPPRLKYTFTFLYVYMHTHTTHHTLRHTLVWFFCYKYCLIFFCNIDKVILNMWLVFSDEIPFVIDNLMWTYMKW